MLFTESNLKTIAKFMVDNKLTIRQTSEKFDVSKSWLHEIIHKYLPNIDENLYANIVDLFRENRIKSSKLGMYTMQIDIFIKDIEKEYLNLKTKSEDVDMVTTYLTDKKIPFEYLEKEGVIKCCRL